ncbi:MAG: biotin--[acetyl-CoA-carboxylase] ligase [Chthoniobacterales bacterium]
MSPVDRLDAEALRAALVGHRIGREVVVLEETTSTNDVIRQLAPAHAEGLIVFAEHQTAGRGQYGRRWESAAGKGLWFSILLRPLIEPAESARLTDSLSRSTAATIADELELQPTIKPPNDIYLDGRKVAGVLVEMRVAPGGRYFAIAGIGLNVNQATEDFPAELRQTSISLAMAKGQPVDRTRLALALLRKLDVGYAVEFTLASTASR